MEGSCKLMFLVVLFLFHVASASVAPIQNSFQPKSVRCDKNDRCRKLVCLNGVNMCLNGVCVCLQRRPRIQAFSPAPHNGLKHAKDCQDSTECRGSICSPFEIALCVDDACKCLPIP